VVDVLVGEDNELDVLEGMAKRRPLVSSSKEAAELGPASTSVSGSSSIR
jgi:hypothetical protein